MAASGKKDNAAETLASKINADFDSFLYASSCAPEPALAAFVKKAGESNIKIGLLSFLPDDKARTLMARTPFEQTAVLHVMKKEADDLPTPDSWLSLLKAMSITPRCAVALVNANQACKSALAVGMSCASIPDAFTVWHDFAGSDLLFESISDLKLNDLLALMTTARFRARAK